MNITNKSIKSFDGFVSANIVLSRPPVKGDLILIEHPDPRFHGLCLVKQVCFSRYETYLWLSLKAPMSKSYEQIKAEREQDYKKSQEQLDMAIQRFIEENAKAAEAKAAESTV